MLQPFLIGLPRYLVEIMEREYEYKCSRLANWRETSRSNRLQPYLRRADVIHQVFALGIYYRHVIAPLTSAGNFVSRLHRDDLSLRVAGKPVSMELHYSLEAARIKFHRLSNAFGLDETFFALSDLRQIVMALVRIDEQRADGNN